MANGYNGWANRETWLVNMYFEDSLIEHLEYNVETGSIDEDMDMHDIAEICKEHIELMLEEELANLSPFISDLINLNVINWQEIATSFMDDIEFPEDEDEEGE